MLISSRKFDKIKLTGGNMIYTFEDLKLKYSDFTDAKGKIRRETENGNLIKIRRGLYESDKAVSGKYLAGSIFGPSYLSFDYALAEYSLIPEAVYNTYTSATFQKNKTKIYENQFGVFTYRDIPAKVYPLGIILHQDNNYAYQIATPEKALCDKLYSLPQVNSIADLYELLFSDLRIDEQSFMNLDKRALQELAKLYRASNLNLLIKLI